MGAFAIPRKNASGNAKVVTVVKGADVKGIASADGSRMGRQRKSKVLEAEDWAHLRECACRGVPQSHAGAIYKDDAKVPVVSSEEAKHPIRLMARTADPRAAKRPAELQEVQGGDHREEPADGGAAAMDRKLDRARITELKGAFVFVMKKSKTLERQLGLSTAEAARGLVRIKQLQAALAAAVTAPEISSKEVACYRPRVRCAALECKQVCLTACMATSAWLHQNL